MFEDYWDQSSKHLLILFRDVVRPSKQSQQSFISYLSSIAYNIDIKIIYTTLLDCGKGY